LILVNPYGGAKIGEAIFSEILKPMFEKAKVDYDYILTTHTTHAFEVHPFNPSNFLTKKSLEANLISSSTMLWRLSLVMGC
jgi:hypothetical protein